MNTTSPVRDAVAAFFALIAFGLVVIAVVWIGGLLSAILYRASTAGWDVGMRIWT
ncbi:MAG: hypothetical protein H0U46_10875 [Actinobacteria bacterium]|nr:hypothetical protein [Actinomycetota bacterium]